MVGDGFGPRAEGGTLHVHVGSAVVDPRLQRSCTLEQDLAKVLRHRMCERNMSHDSAPEECVLEIPLRAVDELVDQHDVRWAVTGLQ